MKVLIRTKCGSGSVEVQEGQVRVIRVSKGFCGDSGRGDVRHAVGSCKAVTEGRKELRGDGKGYQRTERGHRAWRGRRGLGVLGTERY